MESNTRNQFWLSMGRGAMRPLLSLEDFEKAGLL